MIFFLFFIFPSIIFPLYDTRFETLATKFLCAYEIKDPDALNKNAIFIKEFLLTRGSALSKEPQYYKVFEQLYTVIKLIGVSRDLSDYQKLIFNCNLIGKNQKLTWLSTKKDVFDLLFPIVKKFHKEIMISWHNNIVEKNFIELQNKPENFVYHFDLHTEIIRRWHIFGKTELL